MPIDENSVPQTTFPLGSQAGQAIPLSIARPIKGYFDVLATSGSKSYTFDKTRFNIVSVCSTQYARLSTIESASTDDPTPVERYFMLIPDMIYEFMVSEHMTILNLGADNATLIVNQLTRWDQLQNIGAYGRTR